LKCGPFRSRLPFAFSLSTARSSFASATNSSLASLVNLVGRPPYAVDAMPDGQWCWPLFSLRINAPVISSMRAHTNDRIALASFEGRRLMNSRRSFVVLTHPLDKQKLTLGG
jgi:hypothetical protein